MARKPKRNPQTARRRSPLANRPQRAPRRRPAGGAPPHDPPLEPSKALLRRLLAEVRRAPRERWDIYSRMFVNCVEGAGRALGVTDEWVVCYALPPMPLKDERGRRIEADGVLFCSQLAGDTWPQAQALVEHNRQAGIYERPRFKLLVVEAKRRQQPGRDIAQLRAVRAAIRRRFGDEVPVDLLQFLAGPEPSAQETLPITGGNGQEPDDARVVRRDQLDADQVADVIGDSLLGAVALLAMRNGDQPRHVFPTVARLMATDGEGMHSDILTLALHLDAELFTIVSGGIEHWHEERTMANGVAAEPLENMRVYRRVVDELVQAVEDPKWFPTVRKLLNASEREQRKAEREQRKAERALRAKHVDGLLGILAGRGMRLTVTQEKRLRAKPLAKLPAFKLALRAKDATDFAVRAGLTNGRR